MENWSGGVPVGWDKTGSSYIHEENSEKHGGTVSACFEVPSTTTVVELNQDVLITGGNYFSFQCWIFDNTSNGEIGLLINWRNDGGSIGTETSSRSFDGGSWQQLSILNIQAPLTATIARVRIRGYKQGGAGGGYVYIDDALFFDDVSLPVMMGAVSAETIGEAVVIRWSTESEVDLRGFYVLRAEGEDGVYNRVNTALITARGNHSSQSQYEYYDQSVLPGHGYWYQIEMIYADGHRELSEPICSNTFTGNIDIEKSALFSNYPNPFNPETTIRYRVSQKDGYEHAALKIYNITGQEVLTLIDRPHNPGEYAVNWNGCDAEFVPVPSGIYIYRLLSGGRYIDMKRMIKMK
ncbi:T9SS type A sorting domain-containing protein [bacterium]|nr:T9SS type A sorting domain-containing protein [bacterium]